MRRLPFHADKGKLIAIASVAVSLVLAAGTSASTDQRQAAYYGTVSASYTVRVKSTSSPLSAESTARLSYRTKLKLATNPKRGQVVLETAPFQSPVGRYSVAISGTDSEGCAFNYQKTLRTPMKFGAAAEARRTVRPMVSKRVSAGYFLDVVVYPLGITPDFPNVCGGLTTPIEHNPADLRVIFSHVAGFNAAETLLTGAWPRLWNHTGWPFGPIGYMQLWQRPPPRQSGVFQLPAPVNALAAGKPVKLSRSLASTRKLPERPSVTITAVGRVTFTFGR